jgi:hypothetical protein
MWPTGSSPRIHLTIPPPFRPLAIRVSNSPKTTNPFGLTDLCRVFLLWEDARLSYSTILTLTQCSNTWGSKRLNVVDIVRSSPPQQPKYQLPLFRYLQTCSGVPFELHKGQGIVLFVLHLPLPSTHVHQFLEFVLLRPCTNPLEMSIDSERSATSFDVAARGLVIVRSSGIVLQTNDDMRCIRYFRCRLVIK